MGTLDLLKQRRNEILNFAQKHGVYNVRIFGSVGRGEATPDSDIDLLVDKGPNTGAGFPAGLMLELEEMLGQRVEIVTEKALNRHLRDQVLREATEL